MLEVTIKGSDLTDLATVSAFASTDKARPILAGVLIQYDAGSRVIKATATDSYKLATISREVDAGADSFTVLVDGKRLAAATKDATKATIRGGYVRFIFDADAGRVHVGPDSELYPVPVIEGTYPNIETVIPSDAAYRDAAGVNQIAFNPVYVGQFAKIAPWNGKGAQGVTFHMIDAARPVKATSSDGRTVALLMPVRMS